jgi:lipoprotein LprG
MWKADRMLLPQRLAAGAAAAVLSVAGLSACSDDGGGVTENKSADADDDGDISAEEVLALAKTTFDETSGVSLTLETDDLPDGVDGLVSAEGVATHAPAFEGVATVSLSGSPFNVDPLVAVEGKVYASIPGVPITQEIDPEEYGAPDPAQLMDPDEGFSSILIETEDVEEGDTVRGGADNKEVLTEYSGTVEGSFVENIIPSAEGDFDVTYTVAENGELRTARLTGVFYPDSDEMTYTVGIDDYGTEKDISEP